MNKHRSSRKSTTERGRNGQPPSPGEAVRAPGTGHRAVRAPPGRSGRWEAGAAGPDGNGTPRGRGTTETGAWGGAASGGGRRTSAGQLATCGPTCPSARGRRGPLRVVSGPEGPARGLSAQGPRPRPVAAAWPFRGDPAGKAVLAGRDHCRLPLPPTAPARRGSERPHDPAAAPPRPPARVATSTIRGRPAVPTPSCVGRPLSNV